MSTGVAIGALAVETVVAMRNETAIGGGDFAPAFLLVGGIAALSTFMFWRMPADAGAELTDRRLTPAEPTGPAEPPDKRAA